MATDLTGLQVRNTYNSLLKIGDNTSLTGIAKRISDGLGNDSPLFISTSQISIGVAPATGYDLTVNSGIRTGSIDVLGAATAQSLQFTGGGGTQGTMSWNTDEETVDLIQNGATLQLGQETHVHVKNQSGATINDGTPVYVTGTLGASGRLTVAPMIADGSIEAKYFLGVTTEDIPNGEDGKVTTFGKIRGLNTSAYAPGTTLYVSSTTAGFWQTTPPVSPALDLEVAIVINQHANNGTIFVRAQNGQYLGLLHDVYLNSVADNQLLVYNATNSRWENQGIASIGAINLDTVTDNGNTTTNNISVGDINAGNVTLTGYLRGAANFVIDPAAHGDETGVVQILGDLRVDGTTTTINSTTVTIADKNIVLAQGSALPGDANGAGITIDGAAASMTYNSTSDRFVFNKDIETNLVGNADTASALETARNIAVDGAVTGNADFDGSANITITTTVNHNHDDRYYTETESDNRFVNVDGDTMTGDLDFNDNVKAKFGTGDDLTVYHNATNSLIDNATGSILIRNLADDQDIVLASDDGAGSITDYLRVDGSEGSVKLFHYGSEKLVTTATGVSVTGAFSGNLDTSSISGSTIDINGTTRINLQYNGTTQAFVDSTGFNISGGLALTGVDGISLTDEDSTTDSYFHANVDYTALYTVTSNARYGADYIQVDGLDSRSNTRFTISPKDISSPDPYAYLYIGGNNSNTAPNTLVDWHTIYMNALSVRINNNEVATQSWVSTNYTLDLQDVTDNGNTTDNSIIISNAVPLYFTNTGTGTYNKGVMYSNTTDGFLFEAPWETDATTTRVPFILTWRGGMGHGGIKLNGDTQLHTNDSGLGVDITSPSAKLHVGGTSIFDGLMTVNDGNNYAKLGDLNGISTMVLELKDGTNPVQIEAYSEDMRFYTGGAGRMTIASGGNTRIESFNRIEFNNGNQYIYSPDANDLRLGANDDIYLESSYIRFFNASANYEYARLHGEQGDSWISANGGRVGIGTSTPAVTFNVVGEIRGEQSSTHGLRLIGGGGGSAQIYGTDFYYGMNLSTGQTSSTYYLMSLNSGSVNRFYVRSDGNVGIGEDAPDAKLHVTGKASYTTANSSEVSGLGFIRLQPNSDSEHSLWIHNANNNLGISGYADAATTSARDITLQAYGGDVGIGTVQPSAKLHVYVDSANDDTFHIYNGSVRTHLMASEYTNGVIYMRNSSNSNTVRINTSGFTYFNGGNVGIGVVSPDAKLHIQGGNVISNVTDNWHSSSLGTDIIRGGSQVNAISNEVNALKIFPATNTGKSAGNYWGGISFMHLDPETYGSSYTGAQMWIGGRIVDTPGQERSAIVFATNNSTTAGSHPEERMCILPNGTVGIGTTAPPSISSGVPTLSINSPNTNNLSGGFIYQSNGVSKAYHYWENSYLVHQVQGGGHSLNNGGVVLMRVESNGNTKIYASDDSRLTVTDTGDSSNLTMRADANNSIYSNKSLNIYTENADHISFSTNGQSSERMRINSSGNVGIGTTSPNTALQVNQASSAPLLVHRPNNTNFDPHGIVFSTRNDSANGGLGDARAGIFYDYNGDLFLSAAQTGITGDPLGYSRLFVEGSNGNVGIGTTSPGAKLEIYGTGNTLRLDSAANQSKTILLRNVGTATAEIKTDGNLKLWAEDAGRNIYFDTSGGTKMTILSSGNVGIGTTSPSAKLDVAGEIRSTYSSGHSLRLIGGGGGSAQIYGTDFYYGMNLSNSQTSSSYYLMSLNSGVGNVMYARCDGLVGIGTTNPQAKLHVNGRIRINNPSTTGGTNTNQAIYIEHPSLSAEYFTMGFKDTARSGEKMQHPSGPYTNTSAFYIECGSTEAGGICLDQDSVHVYGSSDGGATFRVIDKDADVVTFEMLQTSWNGVFRGDVIAYGSMSSISDKRIKENIEPYENVLDKLCSLGVYSYNKITLPEHKRNRKEIGVIAQEVEAVFPELVNEEKVDKPQDANGLEQIKTVDYEHLTAILLQSIKELRNEVEELKARLDA